MGTKKILVDEHNRELSAHGTDTFPVAVNHDDLWLFEGRNVPIHWHSELEICLPRKGTAVCQIYQESHAVCPGQALLIGSNVPHSCHSMTGESVFYSSIIAAPGFIGGEAGGDVEKKCLRPFLQGAIGPCVLMDGSGANDSQILRILDQIDRLYTEKPCCYELWIKGLLCEAFGMLLSEQYTRRKNDWPVSATEDQARLEQLQVMLEYVHQHYDSPVSLQAIADQCHLSRESCCRIFRKMTGKTITEYLQEYRVSKSLPLIRSGRYSMSQIAELCGFSNASRFASAFRSRMGVNPGHYLTDGRE